MTAEQKHDWGGFLRTLVGSLLGVLPYALMFFAWVLTIEKGIMKLESRVDTYDRRIADLTAKLAVSEAEFKEWRNKVEIRIDAVRDDIKFKTPILK